MMGVPPRPTSSASSPSSCSYHWCCSSISTSSSSSLSPSPSSSTTLHRYFKLASRRCVDGKKYEIKPHKIQGKPAHNVYRYVRSKNQFLIRRLTPLATSEDQSSYTELDLESLESEKLDLDNQDGSSKRSFSYFTGKSEGKPGFISFHGYHYIKGDEVGSTPTKKTSKILWFIGPTVLVAFLVLPSLYLRKILSTFFEDSLLTDFLILFFTEALFYSGVAIFVLLVDSLWRPVQDKAPNHYYWLKTQYGLRVTSVTTLVLTLIIPLLTMGLVWPWTGPAASATLAPYLVGIVVQFAFEQYARHKKSPACAVIPVIFQIYRLHQLNRAAQLVAALSFSVRSAEKTSYTMAISNSLGTLLIVLQILGIICVWSLSSFLMRFLPPSEVIT
ncbi:uncharacterized protein LOC103978726 [Musa acuminata AAA Group]|uniref:uncharacterized protein LOC103978726 n=1 Tax=Musa acuminata AAA Group TaxID=214697 RepID=UPI0031DDAF9B